MPNVAMLGLIFDLAVSLTYKTELTAKKVPAKIEQISVIAMESYYHELYAKRRLDISVFCYMHYTGEPPEVELEPYP